MPASEVKIDQWSKQFEHATLDEIDVQINVAKSNDDKMQLLENAAKLRRFAIVSSPVDFSVSLSANGITQYVTTFGHFVKREIPLPYEVGSSDVSTAIMVEDDGNVRHVPTYVAVRDGKPVAVIRSLSDGTYALIRYANQFADTKNHWAEHVIDDMASRLIISGESAGRFNPDAPVTRAQFTALAVSALGLPVGNDAVPFRDVKSGDWFAGVVTAAKEYGLISGYEGGYFRPADTITRQEAIVILARMMQWATIDVAVSDEEMDLLLSQYADGNETAVWAKQSVAAAIKHGIVVGSEGKLHLSDEITRAETAAIIHRLLQRAKLIDQN